MSLTVTKCQCISDDILYVNVCIKRAKFQKFQQISLKYNCELPVFSLNGGKSSSHKSLPVRFYENYIWLVGFTCSLSIISRILRCPRSWQVPCKCKECFHDTLAIDIYTDTSEKQPDESIKTLPVFCCNIYVLHNSLVN